MENAEAGPSTSASNPNPDSHSTPNPPYTPALPRPLPQTSFYTLEYPGLLSAPTPAQPISASLPEVMRTLGGQHPLDAAFHRTSAIKPIELWLRPGEPFAHPVMGEVVDCRGIVLKVRKRRKRRRAGAEGVEGEGEGGVYTTEAIGTVRKAARFRAMADFSFAPQEPNRILDLRRSLVALDARAITSFELAPEKEDYVLYPPGWTGSVEPSPSPGPSKGGSLDPAAPAPVSNMRLIPPPRFSRSVVPARYDYRQNVATVPVPVPGPHTGEGEGEGAGGAQEQELGMRLQNKFRHSASKITQLAFDEPAEAVPREEPAGAQQKLDPPAMAVLVRVRALFEQRPVWSRLALRNQLTEEEDHVLMNTRGLYTYTGYNFSDGPWREFHIKWGYDPRTTKESRIYQRLQFRNLENDYSRRPMKRLLKGLDPSAEDVDEVLDWRGITVHRNRNSHIFDGKVLGRHVGLFQVCDMTDPLLQSIANDPASVSTESECHPTYGWYTPVVWERLRAIARRKFAALLEGRVLPDAECADLLVDELPGITTLRELRKVAEEKKWMELRGRGLVRRPKGHNLALDPAAPEEEAEVRLRKRLEARGWEGEGFADGEGEEDEEMEGHGEEGDVEME
ncbi:hypothetical protein CALCODRAFT_489420 [Calocera cornea HHB12733]|uniref:Transcription factor IIIC subunit 5 HTH domain-containing protein n=1 Tax=Calocera cornea HHB12733 TaxID=1353952 RepID=A0A165KAG5_9BASI|nr:hypothetical protein CALCODRAFT_489420 [Calocera cornea HHB12733]